MILILMLFGIYFVSVCYCTRILAGWYFITITKLLEHSTLRPRCFPFFLKRGVTNYRFTFFLLPRVISLDIYFSWKRDFSLLSSWCFKTQNSMRRSFHWGALNVSKLFFFMALKIFTFSFPPFFEVSHPCWFTISWQQLSEPSVLSA